MRSPLALPIGSCAKAIIPAAAAILLSACATTTGGRALQTTEHRVPVVSTAPSHSGKTAQIYVREAAPVGSGNAPVVVFVHGAGTPGEVSFDSKQEGYSWMRHVAGAGFDVFVLSLTGYGRSTRPDPMNDPCNIQKSQQVGYVNSPCGPSFNGPLTTPTSDWKDIDAVVDYVRKLRGVDRVSLVGWSQGGPRMSGYAALHPQKVERIVALAPAYFRDSPLEEPKPLPAMADGVMTVQARKDFKANWDRQVGCPDQYDSAAAERIYDEMLESDPAGAKWGAGVRRAPMVPIAGFNKESVARLNVPYLMFAGDHDKQIVPTQVHELYEDLGSKQKVLVDLTCSSHNAMWEKNRLFLYDATVQWLKTGKVNGVEAGAMRLGN